MCFFSLFSSERLRSLVSSYHLRIFVFSAFVVDLSQGLLFFISTNRFLLHREHKHTKLNNFSGYDTIWQHAPVILRLVNYKFRAKLTYMVNQYGATLYKGRFYKLPP